MLPPVPTARASTGDFDVRRRNIRRRCPFGCHVEKAEHLLFARLGLVMLPHVLTNIASYQKVNRIVLRWNCAKVIANIDDLAISIWASKVIDELSQIDDI